MLIWFVRDIWIWLTFYPGNWDKFSRHLNWAAPNFRWWDLRLSDTICKWHCERNMCEIIAINQKPSLCLWTRCRYLSSSQFHRNIKQELQSELMVAERWPVPDGQLWFCSAELTSDTTGGCSLWYWWHVELFLRSCSDLVSTSTCLFKLIQPLN